MQRLSRQRGVSLIEVLMAVLIFSIGLIGLAGLMVMATRSNHAAYQRTQVTFLASTMADRMSANPVGVWSGNYDSTSYPVSASTAANNDCSSGCTPDALAASDQRAWSSQLKTFLPNVKASISCDASKAGFTPAGWTLGTPASGATAAVPAAPGQVGMRPPYGGDCSMRIQWDEQQAMGRKNADGTVPADVQQQTFDWKFQP
ncbi:type IV pilus assembly protein PilV [Dyella sp. OK004]|uniref:type IV pilus modification protein PilV n=1 Tax=Dyella sp. OK004 TaxID=1855292 RepID=UPI0008E433A7|nr:type IV pilus modification protein PilV [Dyella sp. OK004]SFS04917.1 type IV pilus assembly protein PilV [Dyella sp. OK004]